MQATEVMAPYTIVDTDIIMSEDDSQYVLRVKDLPDEDKPREKLAAHGPGSLTQAELMAIFLGVGTKREDVLAMSQRIIREYGEKTIANETNPRRLAESLHIPITKAAQIVACFELGRRSFAQRGGKPVFIRTAKQAYEHLKSMGNLQKEQLRGLYLNSRYQLIREEVISIGSLTANIIHPREVFQPAIEHGAVAVIIAHNHPSGSKTPTSADIDVTEQLVSAGEMLGVTLLDHLIITTNGYMSIVEGASS